MYIEIRPIKETDVAEWRKLSIQTFAETFADTNTAEDMKNYYARAYNEEKLRAELKRENSWFYFALVDGEIAAYLMVNIDDAQTEMGDEDGYEVERIYVLKKYYGTGVGAKLMEFAIEKGRELGKKYLWLGVFEENFRAQRFYRKFGLEEFSEHVFMMGKTPQRDVLMKVGLAKGE